jgi:hypothetical protein
MATGVGAYLIVSLDGRTARHTGLSSRTTYTGSSSLPGSCSWAGRRASRRPMLSAKKLPAKRRASTKKSQGRRRATKAPTSPQPPGKFCRRLEKTRKIFQISLYLLAKYNTRDPTSLTHHEGYNIHTKSSTQTSSFPPCPLPSSIAHPSSYKAKTPAIAAAAPTPIYCTSLSLFAAAVLLGLAALALLGLALTPTAWSTTLCTLAFVPS